jgi:hypothetical protein
MLVGIRAEIRPGSFRIRNTNNNIMAFGQFNLQVCENYTEMTGFLFYDRHHIFPHFQ